LNKIFVLAHPTNGQRACARRNPAVACNLTSLIHATLDFLQQNPRSAHHITAFQTGWRLKLKQKILKFMSDESGATAIEYGLIAAGIALAIIAVVNGLGTNLNTQFTSINNSLK
jgi:pilus assembly protein Flp/PilA